MSMLVFCGAMAWSPSANAAERLEPGIRLVRPDGVEVVLDTERLLLDRNEVSNIVVLVRDLEACRQAWEGCEKRPSRPERRPIRWTIAVAVLAGFSAGIVASELSE